MSQLHESTSDNPSETTCYHCKCANAAKEQQRISPDICYAEQSVEDQSLNDSGSNRIASDIVWRNLGPPKHVGGTPVPIVTARHVDIMRAKLAGRFDRHKKNAGACKRKSGTSD